MCIKKFSHIPNAKGNCLKNLFLLTEFSIFFFNPPLLYEFFLRELVHSNEKAESDLNGNFFADSLTFTTDELLYFCTRVSNLNGHALSRRRG